MVFPDHTLLLFSVHRRMEDVRLDVERNEKEQLRESYDVSCSIDMKHTYLKSMKINMGNTERIEGPVYKTK